MNYTHFYNDYEKMIDFRNLTKEEFLQSYSYLTEEEYDATVEVVKVKCGASKYNLSKHVIDLIASKYSCAGDVIMKTAIQYIVEFGQDRFKDEEFIEKQTNQINARHDAAEADGKVYLISRQFETAILNCSRDLAYIPTYDLIIYMQKSMFWSQNDGGPDYNRLREIAEKVMDWMVCDSSDSSEDYDTFVDYCGIEDDELEWLGFRYLIPEESEDEE